MNTFLRHIRSLRCVERRDEIVSCLCIQTERVSQTLKLWGLFEIGFLESVATSVEVLFDCVEANVLNVKNRLVFIRMFSLDNLLKLPFDWTKDSFQAVIRLKKT